MSSFYLSFRVVCARRLGELDRVKRWYIFSPFRGAFSHCFMVPVDDHNLCRRGRELYPTALFVGELSLVSACFLIFARFLEFLSCL